MAGYEIPPSEQVESLTSEQAEQAINKVQSEYITDNEHPYMNANHPQHESFVNYMNALYGRKSPTEQASEPVMEVQQEYLEDNQPQTQAERVGKAQEIMAQLEEHGFERVDVPETIADFEVSGLQQQLFAAQGNWPEVTIRLGADLQRLSSPSHIQKIFSAFIEAPDSDAEFKEKVANELITWVHRKYKEQRSK